MIPAITTEGMGEQPLNAGNNPGDTLIWDGKHWTPSTGGAGPSPPGSMPIAVGPMAWTPFIDLVNANAYQRPIIMNDGVWTFDAIVPLASGAHIIGGPGVTINATTGLLGNVLNAAFNANLVIAANTTVDTAVVVGSRTVIITAPNGFAPGDLIRLSKGGLLSMTYTVVSVVGAGPTTITVERPILYQYDPADVVSRLTSMPQDIIIEGNGMLMTGVSDRYIELANSRRCIVKDIRGVYNGAANANIMFSYDVGGYDNVFENLECDGGAQMQLGISLESNEDSHILNCKAHNVTNWGFPLYSCAHCTIQYSEAFRCGNGIGLVADGASPGCRDCDIVESHGTGCTTDGIVVQNVSNRIRIRGGSYSYNGGHGLNVAANSLDTSVDGVLFEGNLTRQAIVFAGADRTTMTGCHMVSAVNTVGLYVLGQVYASGCQISAGNIGIFCDGELHLSNSRVQASTLECLEVRPNRFCTVHNCDFNCATIALTAVTLVNPARCYVDGLSISGLGAGGTGITVQAACTLRYHDYDPGAAAVPLNVVAGGFASTGLLVSGGAGAAQAVAWPDIKATDAINWERTVNGGAPGIMPLSVITPGVGFAATFAGGDTSTYRWRVE